MPSLPEIKSFIFPCETRGDASKLHKLYSIAHIRYSFPSLSIRGIITEKPAGRFLCFVADLAPHYSLLLITLRFVPDLLTRHAIAKGEKGEEKETIRGSAFERNAATLATLGEH